MRPFSPPYAPEPRLTQSGPFACRTWLDICGLSPPPHARSAAAIAIPRIFFIGFSLQERGTPFHGVPGSVSRRPSRRVDLQTRIFLRDERCREIVSRAETCFARRGLLRCLGS